MIARHIKHAARVIDRVWFAPRRRAKLAKAIGVQDLITKIDVAKRQHKPCAASQRALEARIAEALREDVQHG